MKSVPYLERDLVHKMQALKAIQVTLDALSKNYPIEGVEQEVFERVKKFLKVVRGTYEQE